MIKATVTLNEIKKMLIETNPVFKGCSVDDINALDITISMGRGLAVRTNECGEVFVSFEKGLDLRISRNSDGVSITGPKTLANWDGFSCVLK